RAPSFVLHRMPSHLIASGNKPLRTLRNATPSARKYPRSWFSRALMLPQTDGDSLPADTWPATPVESSAAGRLPPAPVVVRRGHPIHRRSDSILRIAAAALRSAAAPGDAADGQ